ncbi:DUF1850 domain-containing protein [Bacillaceae bacterium W0354]
MALLILLFVKIPVFQFVINNEPYYLVSNNFTISWVHSVEKEKWYEKYTKKNGVLLLTETRFKTFGAGVPANGEIISTQQGYVQMRIDREIPVLNLIVSHNVKTIVETNDDIIPLYELTNDYEEITISVQNVHLWDLLGRRFL